MSSPGMLSYLNGPSARVVGIQSLQGYPAATGSYLTCQGTIVLKSGAQEMARCLSRIPAETRSDG
jgi:hypothetical protein